jgi:hypothetical protein
MPEDRFASLNEMLAEIEAPPEHKRASIASYVMIGASLAAAAAGAFVVFNNLAQERKATETIAATQSPATNAPPSNASGGGTTDNRTPVEPSGGGTTDNQTPVEPPPPAETKPSVVATVPEKHPPAQSEVDAISATPLPAQQPQRVAKADPAPTRTTYSPAGSNMEGRRQQCISQCERDDGECRSLSRRGKQECMRAVAFGSGAGRLSTNPATASCAFFGQSRCEYALDRAACLARMSNRYKNCLDVLGGTVASRRQDCDVNSRESELMCRDSLRECRASCE